MKGKPLYPWAVTAVVGIVAMIILSFVGLGQMPTEEAEGDAPPAEEQATDATGTDGPELGSCVGCHGGDLSGGAGPALIGTDLSHDEIVDTIINGATGMPGGLVSEAEADAIATYILEQ
ncbi:c-type cytochrome [Anaerobacillus sp. MEB173]|uniref:c-type cytochrome n=1 Tax=Anaerobacillus sp. MEB173 TaxID=3383345 RepID=UPI003F8EE620